VKLNPVFKNEIKLSSRTMKSSWMVFGYNAVLIVVSMMVLYSMMNSVHYGYSMDYSETVSLYVVMAYIEFGMILLIIPAITAGSGGGCRFTPSCSNYTMQAIMTHGCVKGILLGAWRIARCNPFGKWGFDPVPEPGRWQNPARRLQPAKLFSTRHKQKVEK